MKLTADDYDAFNASLITSRRCGDCDLCCTAVRVSSMDKPAGTRCRALNGPPGASCTIYDKRPDECRGFLCLWRGADTTLPNWMYPADCGFVVAIDGHFGQFPTVITIHPDPARPDAWMATRNIKWFKKLAHDFNAIVVVGQAPIARHIFAPSGREFTRENAPHLFKNDVGQIGLPSDEFLPVRHTPDDLCFLLWGRRPGDVVHPRGFEPRLADSKSAVLPLDEG